jgi:plasmid stabilization system protein ParE
MARLVVTATADADIRAIQLDLIRAAGLHTAEKYTALFERIFDLLADFPQSGSNRSSFGKDIRIGIVSPYLVIYRYRETSDTVTVLRVIHGRRNVTAKLISE